MKVISILVGGVLTSNFVFMQYLRLCPFVGLSGQFETAVGMSAAVVFVMTFASTVAAAFEQFILAPLGLQYMRTIAYILVIAAFVQLVEIFLKKTAPGYIRLWGSTSRSSPQLRGAGGCPSERDQELQHPLEHGRGPGRRAGLEPGDNRVCRDQRAMEAHGHP